MGDSLSAEYGDAPPTSSPYAAAFMREYQLMFGYTPGPLMAAFLIVALCGAVGLGRWRGAPECVFGIAKTDARAGHDDPACIARCSANTVSHSRDAMPPELCLNFRRPSK